MINTPDPTCKLECRFTTSFAMTTDTYYPPVYDKHGVNTNPDRNTTTATVQCVICEKKWIGNTYFADGHFQTAYKEIM